MKCILLIVLALSFLSVFHPALAASFDCAKAKTSGDRMICSDPQLSTMDDKLAALYQKVKSESQNKEALIANEASAWNNREANCSNKACLVAWYDNRIMYLTDLDSQYQASGGTAEALYIAKPDGTQMTCSDEKITAELHDLLTTEADNPGISNGFVQQVYDEGNCSPIAVKFKVVRRVVLQIPAGPQNLVEIEIPNLVNPTMAPETSWMMASDVEPAVK